MGRNVTLLLLLGLASVGRAEDVESRTTLASTATRIRGAATVVPVPWGFVGLGGSALRQLPTGKTAWQTLHTVPHDSLYRVASDDRGRLLAAWEKEPVFHLFIPRTRQDLTIPKPAQPTADFRMFNLQELYFSPDGAAAIVYMEGLTGSCSMTTVVYRIPLAGPATPVLLARQTGSLALSSGTLAVFVVPTNTQQPCGWHGCFPIAAIVAYPLTDRPAAAQTILSGASGKLDSAQMIFGSNSDRLAMVVVERPNERHLLRWRPGDPAGDYRPLPKAPAFEVAKNWVTRSGDVVEAWNLEDRTLELRRYPPQGEPVVTHLRPIPQTDPDVEQDDNVYTLKDRKNGDLFLHRGNALIELPAGAPPRYVNLEPLLKRRNEWAGAGIYVPEPETLWVGIEVGSSRDFVRLKFADLDRLAKPMP